MTARSWDLLDCDRDIDVSTLKLGPAELGETTHGRGSHVTRRTLHGGLRDGVDYLEIDNGVFRFVVLPQRGLGLWRAWLKCPSSDNGSELELGWHSPNRGPVHPRFVPIAEASGLGWLDGFDELLCRCGLVSNGAPEFDDRGQLQYPLHGRIANRPAHKLTLSVAEDGEISLTGVVDESRFHFYNLRLTSTFRTRPGEPGVRITDEITNLSARPGEAQLLYHINVGPPLLGPGAQVVAPVKKLMPRTSHAAAGLDDWTTYGAPDPACQEQVYFLQLASDANEHSELLLKNAASNRGLSVQFHHGQLPYFCVWKNTAAEADGYVTGLEPTVNFPNPRSYEKSQQRVISLAPGETRRFELALQAWGDVATVTAAEGRIERLREGITPDITSTPQEPWVMP